MVFDYFVILTDSRRVLKRYKPRDEAGLDAKAMEASKEVAMPEPMRFTTVGGENGAPRPWIMDERDGFISWLRGEFAAANAIIDLLMFHLAASGSPGAYEGVLESINERRYYWTPILHMQQYFPVADVASALQQVEWSQRQLMPQRYSCGPKGTYGKKYGAGHRYGHRSDGILERHGSVVLGTAVVDDGNVRKKDGQVENGNDVHQKNDALTSQTKYSSFHAEKDGEHWVHCKVYSPSTFFFLDYQFYGHRGT